MINIIGHAFNIIIFISMMGSIFSILALFVRKILQIVLPLWVDVSVLLLFLFPVIAPTLKLIDPQKTRWLDGYKTACTVWFIGLLIFCLYYALRSILASLKLKSYEICDDLHINQIFSRCLSEISYKNCPALYVGTLNDPACVVTILRPVIIINKTIIKQLSDKELAIVFRHELTHIHQKHHIYQRIYDFISMIHWFNPLMWISRIEFNTNCEIDCDRKLLSAKRGSISEIEYATTMLHVLELSSHQSGHRMSGLKAHGYLLARQRIQHILNKPVAIKQILGILLIAIAITLTLLLSVYFSRSYFYPYPASDYGTEYASCRETP